MNTKLDQTSALIAISGGVDSVLLTFLLAKNLSKTSSPKITNPIDELLADFAKELKLTKIELAYIDHSQRDDTSQDLKVIQELAKNLSLVLTVQKLELPPKCSEALARQERYKALAKIQKDRGLEHLITAHHADDVLETSLINLIRGTGPRGLSSLKHQPTGTWRPYLYRFEEGIHITKKDIIKRAQELKLNWHEDSTNQETHYLRNRIRLKLSSMGRPELKTNHLQILSRNQATLSNLQAELQNLLTTLTIESDSKNLSLDRPKFNSLPDELKTEIILTVLHKLGAEPDRRGITKAVEFIKNSPSKKTLQLKGCHIYIQSKEQINFISTS